MKTGDRLRKLLDDKGISQSLVGRKCSPAVSPQSVGRWIRFLNNDTITDEQWLKFCHGLRAAGVKPEEIRPIPVTVSRLRTELLPLLDAFDNENQLEALISLLTADGDAVEPVLLLAQDRLKRMKKQT